MKQFLAWLDATSARTFNRVKWALSIFSATLTSAVVLSLQAEL